MTAPRRQIHGTGWKFPIRLDPRGGIAVSSGETKIEESIWLILSTAPKERIMRPRFGCGIHALVFAPNNAATHGAVAHQVHTALTRWEPRIDVLEVTVSEGVEENQLLIRIDYRVRGTNTAANLVYPFYLQGGTEG